MSEAKNAEAELALARFLAHVKYENGDYVLHDWPIPQSLHDAKTLARALLSAGYAKREDVLERSDIKDAPRDGSVIWAHIRADLPAKWPEQEGAAISAWADRWVPIKHGGYCDGNDGERWDMYWTVALPVGFGGLADDWFDDWTPQVSKGQP